MVEKTIHSIDELIEFIYRFIDNSEIGIVELERQSGISQGLISRWKSHSCKPNLTSLINVLNCLNIDFVLKSSESSHSESMEQEIHSIDELLKFIYQYIDNSEIGVGELEEQSSISQGLISRWKKNSSKPRLEVSLDVLNSLNIQIVLKTYNLEEEKLNQDILAYVKTITSSNITLFNKKLFLDILQCVNSIISSDMTSSDKNVILNILECINTMISSNMTLSDKELILNILNSSIQLYHR